MAYKRRVYSTGMIHDSYSTDLTKVSIHWSFKASAYQIYFHKNGKWFPTKERFQKIQSILITFINNLPYGEKEKQVKISQEDVYDMKARTNKTQEVQDWTYFIHEKHVNNFRNLVEMMPEDFEVDFIEKPLETNTFTSKFVPVEVWLDKFKEITNNDISRSDFNTARSIYRKFCIQFHPDKNRDDNSMHEKMSKLNEVWTNLEYQHFKTKQMPVFESVEQ